VCLKTTPGKKIIIKFYQSLNSLINPKIIDLRLWRLPEGQGIRAQKRVGKPDEIQSGKIKRNK